VPVGGCRSIEKSLTPKSKDAPGGITPKGLVSSLFSFKGKPWDEGGLSAVQAKDGRADKERGLGGALGT